MNANPLTKARIRTTETRPHIMTLANPPVDVTGYVMAFLERFVIYLYDSTCNLSDINEARQYLFWHWHWKHPSNQSSAPSAYAMSCVPGLLHLGPGTRAISGTTRSIKLGIEAGESGVSILPIIWRKSRNEYRENFHFFSPLFFRNDFSVFSPLSAIKSGVSILPSIRFSTFRIWRFYGYLRYGPGYNHIFWMHIAGLAQDWSNSIVNALEMLQSSTICHRYASGWIWITGLWSSVSQITEENQWDFGYCHSSQYPRK